MMVPRRCVATALAVPLVALLIGCAQSESVWESPLGPSELALSLTLTATPDVLPLDGRSQSSVEVWARNSQGTDLAGVTLWLHLSTTEGVFDFGDLSSRQVVTGTDGRARATYTAPRVGGAEGAATDDGRVVTVWATPVGTDHANAVARSLTIRVVPAGRVTRPFDIVPGLRVTPEAPAVLDRVTFSATCLTPDETPCVHDPSGVAWTYSWELGDGAIATGRTVTHAYSNPGTYVVALTIHDGHGQFAVATRSIVIMAGVAPSPMIVASPTRLRVGDRVFFNAASSIVGPGRTLVSYTWDFGDGDTAMDVAVSHTYDRVGAFTVTLTVVDDRGQEGTTTLVVDIDEVDGVEQSELGGG